MPFTVVVITTVALYVVVLFLLVRWADSRTSNGKGPADNALVWTLALAVFCSSWTFYGSVGKAASSGLLFFAPFLGASLAVALWWIFLRRLIRIKRSHRITSIADFLSARYATSHAVAVVATLIACVATLPYIALQLKAVASTFQLVLPQTAAIIGGTAIGPLSAVLLVVFTILIGARRIDPTQRHPGLLVAVAAQSVVKLVALVVLGLFVTFGLNDGLGDLLSRAGPALDQVVSLTGRPGMPAYALWTTHLVLGMSAIMFLPRQFHVAVVEASEERHILTAMWLLPLYLLLITLFVVPITLQGLAQGLPATQADTFVLQIPILAGRPGLVLAVFLGGLSAALSMVMVTTVTMATMLINHIVLPALRHLGLVRPVRHFLLQLRWLAIAVLVAVASAFATFIGDSLILVDIGILSFAAILQLAPAAIGALVWRGGSRVGALVGMGSGISAWLYTLLLPSLGDAGWSWAAELAQSGPFGLALLRPEALLGLGGLDRLTQAVLWSLLVNVVGFVAGSLIWPPGEREALIANELVGIASEAIQPRRSRSPSSVDLPTKTPILEQALSELLSSPEARELIDAAMQDEALLGRRRISVVDLTRLASRIERRLAGRIGAALAHDAVLRVDLFDSEDTQELSAAYSAILSELRVTPAELKARINYLVEREDLLQRQAEDLRRTLCQRDREIAERERVEQALRCSEQRFRSIFDGAVEGIFQTTPEGTFLSANPAMARLLGYTSASELIATVTDVGTGVYVNPDDRRRLTDLLVRDGVAIGFLTRLRRCDGSKVWVRISATAQIKDDGGLQCLQGFVEDITRRVEAEEALVAERRLFIGGGTVVFKRQNLSGWPVQFVSPNVTGQLGYVPEELVSGAMPYASLIHADDLGRVNAEIEARSAEGAPCFEQEYRLRRSDGEYRWVHDFTVAVRDEQGRVTHFHGYVIDITERKQAENAAERMRRYLKSVVDSMPSIIIGVAADGRVTEWNRRAEHATGVGAASAIGRPLPEVFPWLGGRLQDARRAIDLGQTLTEERVSRLEPSGRRFYDVVFYPVAGQPIADAVIRVDDVTDRVKLEQVMVQTEKMMSVGGVAAGMAHEINNPLGGILQSIQNVLRRVSTELPRNLEVAEECGIDLNALGLYLERRRIRDLLEGMSAAGERAAQIVADMLQFSRPSEIEVVPTDLALAVDRVLTLAALDHDLQKRYDFRHIEVVREYDPATPLVSCSPTQMELVFFNLIKNAAQAMQSNTTTRPSASPRLTVRVRPEDSRGSSPEVSGADGHPRSGACPAMVRVEVEDSGPGVVEDVRRRLFATITTTKDIGDGTGLGLAVCHFIVSDLHGGDIEIEPERQQGTCIVVRLPVRRFSP